MFHSLDISTSGLVAQRQRLNTIAANIANVNTTRNEQGEVEPYQRRFVTFLAEAARNAESSANQGAKVDFQIEVDQQSEPRLVHQPGHPDANPQGFVSFPNINLTTEFVNALEASRAYEANIATIDLTKEMFQQTLRLIS